VLRGIIRYFDEEEEEEEDGRRRRRRGQEEEEEWGRGRGVRLARRFFTRPSGAHE
jgi:hypothetical protein